MTRVWLFPEGIERTYVRLLRDLSRRVRRELVGRLAMRGLLQRRNDADIVTDTWSDELSQLILEILAAMLGPEQSAIFRLRDTFTAISQFNDTQWRIQVRAGTGIEIGGSGAIPSGARMALGSTTNPASIRAVFGTGVDVYRSEPWLARLQENWVAENTSLIKSITGRQLEQAETVIRTGVMQGWSVKTLQAEILRVSNVSASRAKLIARDQIGKANGALTKHRQEDLGVSRYEWMDSDDRRVRPTHNKANGNIYEWKKGPAITKGHHPGEEVQCRCWARPILVDIVEGRAPKSQYETLEYTPSN